MKTPKLQIRFIANAYTARESKGSKVIAAFVLEATDESREHWAMNPAKVTFPTGDVITVSSEVTKYGNYVHIRNGSGDKRLCSLKTSGSVNVMFLLPCGEEAYAELSDGEHAL